MYFNLNEFKDSEMKRALVRVANKRAGKRDYPVEDDNGRKNKKQRK